MVKAASPMVFDRAQALQRLATETFDVLVVGGGITGAGVALDAASRGLRTALVERDDFASGTSSKSSKMVHGGIRYLQHGDVKIVWQALRERRRLLENAPHLVRPLGFMIPIYTRGGLIPRFVAHAFRIVLFLYDLVGGSAIVGRHRRLTRAEALHLMPNLKPDRLHSALLYYDARTDDARLTLMIARTAADHGAVVANYLPLVEIIKDSDGKAIGARVETGQGRIDVSARCVVNAAGVWMDEVTAADVGPGHEMMRPARGVHMAVPASAVEVQDVAVILAAGGGSGSVFAVPWGDFVYIGTTDTDFSGPLDDLYVSGTEVDILLANLNPSLQRPLGIDEVRGSWAGLRPLMKTGGGEKTADLSRRHRVTRSASDLVSIAGGETDDVSADGRRHRRPGDAGPRPERECRTKSLAIRGAAGQGVVEDEHLKNRYGGDATAVLALIAADPALGQPLVPGLPYRRAEAVYAAQHEMVVTLDDIFARRTRARLFARDATSQAAEEVADLVAGPLGWSRDEKARQVERYRASVAAEQKSIESSPTLSERRRASEGWAPAVTVPKSLA